MTPEPEDPDLLAFETKLDPMKRGGRLKGQLLGAWPSSPGSLGHRGDAIVHVLSLFGQGVTRTSESRIDVAGRWDSNTDSVDVLLPATIVLEAVSGRDRVCLSLHGRHPWAWPCVLGATAAVVAYMAGVGIWAIPVAIGVVGLVWLRGASDRHEMASVVRKAARDPAEALKSRTWADWSNGW